MAGKSNHPLPVKKKNHQNWSMDYLKSFKWETSKKREALTVFLNTSLKI
jgi:hypothetical protein